MLHHDDHVNFVEIVAISEQVGFMLKLLIEPSDRIKWLQFKFLYSGRIMQANLLANVANVNQDSAEQLCPASFSFLRNPRWQDYPRRTARG